MSQVSIKWYLWQLIWCEQKTTIQLYLQRKNTISQLSVVAIIKKRVKVSNGQELKQSELKSSSRNKEGK